MMNIESPFKGIPEELLWFVFGLIFILISGYLITLVNFGKEPDITLIWLMIALIFLLVGLISIAFGVSNYLMKIKSN